MENESLMVSFNISLDSCQEGSRKIAIFGEIIAILEVDNGGFGGDGSRFGLNVEIDKGVAGFCKVVIDDIRGGSTENTGNFTTASDETGEAESGVAGRILLIIGRFVGFIDDNQTEIIDRGEEGGARADDDLGVGRNEGVKPDFATFGHGLLGVHENNTVTEGIREDFDELAGQSDLGDEEDGGFLRFKGI